MAAANILADGASASVVTAAVLVITIRLGKVDGHTPETFADLMAVADSARGHPI